MDNRTLEEVRKNEDRLINELEQLEQENQSLKKQLEELEEENFNLRENIYIERISFPSEGRNFKELIEMPTYEELQQENKKYKEAIDKLKELIESKNNGVCVINGKEKEAFTFLLDFDKAREFIWKLLDILKEVK